MFILPQQWENMYQCIPLIKMEKIYKVNNVQKNEVTKDLTAQTWIKHGEFDQMFRNHTVLLVDALEPSKIFSFTKWVYIRLTNIRFVIIT